jgi:hypothetical protein
MNTINIPGFSAAGSLYRTNGHYRGASDGFNSALSVVPALCYPEGCGDCVGGWETCCLGGHASRRPCTARCDPCQPGGHQTCWTADGEPIEKSCTCPQSCGPCQPGGQQWCTDTQCRVSSQPCNTCKAGQDEKCQQDPARGGSGLWRRSWNAECVERFEDCAPCADRDQPYPWCGQMPTASRDYKECPCPPGETCRRECHQVCGWQMNWWVGFFTWQCDTLCSEVLFCQPES